METDESKTNMKQPKKDSIIINEKEKEDYDDSKKILMDFCNKPILPLTINTISSQNQEQINTIINAKNNNNVNISHHQLCNVLKNSYNSMLIANIHNDIDKDNNKRNSEIIRLSNVLKYFFCIHKKKNDLLFFENFRKKMLSEEHLYMSHINLYFLEKLLDIEETEKFSVKELYQNL